MAAGTRDPNDCLLLRRLENLQEDDLDKLRQRRMDEMKKMQVGSGACSPVARLLVLCRTHVVLLQSKRAEWMSKGHGEYQDIPGDKEFFAAMKGEERMVAHFYRENWPCKVMDRHLEILCKKHLECRFIKINAEKCPFLVGEWLSLPCTPDRTLAAAHVPRNLAERLNIWMLPTLALIKSEKTIGERRIQTSGCTLQALQHVALIPQATSWGWTS